MRKLYLTPVAVVAAVPLLAGCGGSSPSTSSSTSPSAPPSASPTASAGSANASACSKLMGDLTSLQSLATISNPSPNKVAAKFRSAAYKFDTDASGTTASLKAAVHRFSSTLSHEASQISSGKVKLTQLPGMAGHLASQAAPIEQACSGAGSSSSP